MMKGIRVLQFIRASGRLGGGSASLAVILLIISIEEHLRRQNVSAYWFILLAGVFFCFGAYNAWSNEHDALVQASEKNSKPSLQIELLAAFFEVDPVPDKKDLQVHVYTYLRVTNLTAPEALIRDGSLTISVLGIQYKGLGDDARRMGNALEHVSDFRIGGEMISSDAFANTLSPFIRLLSNVNANRPLRQGLTQEGFVAFAFPEIERWTADQDHAQYGMDAPDIDLCLRDSYGGLHSVHIPNLRIEGGSLQNVGLHPRSIHPGLN
ncbi:MAG TPA: hypothetical protein VKX41_15790 [Alloacidobacterium sp.]|nr:hypothetical protein [Alloacidobacterium sp.]